MGIMDKDPAPSSPDVNVNQTFGPKISKLSDTSISVLIRTDGS